MDETSLRTPGGLTVPEVALAWSFARAGGPGGQHVNTSSTKATLTIAVDAIVGPAAVVDRVRSTLGPEVRVTSQASRSQMRNREDCLQRAMALIDIAARPPARLRKPTKPKRAAVERRLDDKRRVSEKKQERRRSEW